MRSPVPAACPSPSRTTRRSPRRCWTGWPAWSSPAARSTSDPALYGATTVHATVTLKDRRTVGRTGAGAGCPGAQHARARHLRRPAAPRRGPRRHPHPAYPGQRCPARSSTSSRTPATNPAMPVAIVPGTQLHRIVGAAIRWRVNSAHHQAVAASRPARHRQRHRAGRRDRGRGGRPPPLRPRPAMAPRVPHRRRGPPRVRRLHRGLRHERTRCDPGGRARRTHRQVARPRRRRQPARCGEADRGRQASG